MPDKTTIERARKDRREGKSPSTQAGEFVRAEIDKIRRGEHGARSPEQAIAIGLSEARRAGVPLKPPGKGKAKARTRRSAEYAYEAGQHKRRTRRRPKVARAVKRALEREPRSTVSRGELSRHANERRRVGAPRRGRQRHARRRAPRAAAAARQQQRSGAHAGAAAALPLISI